MPTLDELVPYQDPLPLPPKPNPFDLRKQGNKNNEVEKSVELKLSTTIRYSSQLPPTNAWTYNGTVPGPFFIVDNGQTVKIRWHNQISKEQTLPYQAVVFPDASPQPVDQPPPPSSSCACSPAPSRVQLHPPQNYAGAGGGVVDEGAAGLTASTVTHLHGGLTAPDSDGWAENVYQYGRSQYCTYGKAGRPEGEEQRGTLLWYHDHAMGVTRLNVYAGLFGLWILRDAAEYKAIKNGVLPDEDHEYFLVIQDRNFAADASGNLTGDLLHKTETSTAEMFGPCTLVNGKLWPTCSVPATRIRLRILNGSNARTYCLRFVKCEPAPGDPWTVKYTMLTKDAPLPVWQVGSDGGLLLNPVDLSEPNQGLNLVLAPAERADVVVDFTGFATQTLAIVNTAFAPFHGSTITNPNQFNVDGTSPPEPDQTIQNAPTQDDPNIPSVIQPADPGTSANPETYLPFRLRFPHVLQFVVKAATRSRSSTKKLTSRTVVDASFKRYVHSADDLRDPKHEFLLPANHKHRWIALSENPTGNLTFRELEAYTDDPDMAAAAPADTPLIPIAAMNGVVTWYKTVAKAFHDAASFFIEADGCEVWNILNLTGDTHPVHVHLVQFQILTRQRVNASSFQTPPGTSSGPPAPVTPLEAPRSPDDNELGFKDTVRANPGEVVQIAAIFTGYCGKYMYHCHILEHEDHDMMRPFIVVAPDAFAMMATDMPGMTM